MAALASLSLQAPDTHLLCVQAELSMSVLGSSIALLSGQKPPFRWAELLSCKLLRSHASCSHQAHLSTARPCTCSQQTHSCGVQAARSSVPHQQWQARHPHRARGVGCLCGGHPAREAGPEERDPPHGGARVQAGVRGRADPAQAAGHPGRCSRCGRRGPVRPAQLHHHRC